MRGSHAAAERFMPATKPYAQPCPRMRTEIHTLMAPGKTLPENAANLRSLQIDARLF
jgi:hypothetical protein